MFSVELARSANSSVLSVELLYLHLVKHFLLIHAYLMLSTGLRAVL